MDTTATMIMPSQAVKPSSGGTSPGSEVKVSEDERTMPRQQALRIMQELRITPDMLPTLKAAIEALEAPEPADTMETEAPDMSGVNSRIAQAMV